MPKSAAIVGWSHTVFGKSEAPDVESLIAEVAGAALDRCGRRGGGRGCHHRRRLQQRVLAPRASKAALVALGQPALGHAPSVHVENACATGSAAIHAALDFIECGRGPLALVVGAEKMTALPTPRGLRYPADRVLPQGGGRGRRRLRRHLRAASLRSYFQRYGDRSEELARIAAKNHRNGVDNPYAQMRKDLGLRLLQHGLEQEPAGGAAAAPYRLLAGVRRRRRPGDRRCRDRATLQRAIAFPRPRPGQRHHAAVRARPARVRGRPPRLGAGASSRPA